MLDTSQLSKAQQILYTNINNAIKAELLSYYEANSDKSFCILLSGGYDSRYVLYTCLELCIPIKSCYTFCIPNHESSDVRIAKRVCEKANIPLKVVTLPSDPSEILNTFEILASKFHCKKKTEFECVLPLYYTFAEIKEDVILVGTDSDNYFALGRNYALHFSHLENGLQLYKDSLFNDPNDGQIQQRDILCKMYTKKQFDVFNTSSVYEAFLGTSWNELNKPHKKGPLYYQFKSEYDAIEPYKSSYQCGDSNIREFCQDILLNSRYNVGNYKTATGCYNQILRELHQHNRRTLF